ncbi:NAD(P)H-hydrate dehydratase [Sphingomonas lenta]|uniref:Bifunctional NAD(P)H-hydrate repair enzyme n=1 Tax=Sphingomonas lenta TaxID=1141887 RepID=A0A2A2SGQ0_9SPHN|nr:NAD(P)H-hydrate dehydratase [Sphingomonas lenta]PAX08436.1 bifunctional ADP-dependent NAD(P)H-hydrate dehydratase/NAD(P)H-hydrate epimerase [Sphingomonas lenta]
MIPIHGQPILTAAQMRAAEEAAAPTPDAMYALMERAGAGVAEAVRRLSAGAEALILCGPGNNGGDGYVAARILREQGHPVRLAAASEPKSDLARRARAGWDGPVERLADADPAPVLVDALFGTGLARSLDEGLTAPLHRLADAARLRLAVDLPSGVATDDGAVPSEPPRFDVTLALGALKPAHLLQPAARYMGELRLLDIGVPAPSRTRALARPTLPEPGPDSHKFTRGLVCVVSGEMPGAAELAATAAAHAGAGYVLLLGAEASAPHAIVRRPWSLEALSVRKPGAVVIGPGLGREDKSIWIPRLSSVLATPYPVVLDGDALRHLSNPHSFRGPTILTPHAGEFDHLFGLGQGSKIDRARAAAERSGATIVFKGADTVIASPHGDAIVAPEASAWLSTAGTGDVLAGACGAMLAAGLDPLAAAEAAVWLHGRAARRLGPAFLADDLAEGLSACR